MTSRSVFTTKISLVFPLFSIMKDNQLLLEEEKREKMTSNIVILILSRRLSSSFNPDLFPKRETIPSIKVILISHFLFLVLSAVSFLLSNNYYWPSSSRLIFSDEMNLLTQRFKGFVSIVFSYTEVLFVTHAGSHMFVSKNCYHILQQVIIEGRGKGKKKEDIIHWDFY